MKSQESAKENMDALLKVSDDLTALTKKGFTDCNGKHTVDLTACLDFASYKALLKLASFAAGNGEVFSFL